MRKPDNRKLKVAVLCGGPSAEREVSLSSGKQVFKALDSRRFKPELVVWGRDRTPPLSIEEFKRFDVVLIVMHGPFGEDGTVQAFLELVGVPYTGSGVAASALGMDKVASKLVFCGAGILVPDYRVAHTVDQARRALGNLGLPCVVKPSAQGSSVGVSIVRKKRDLPQAFSAAVRYDGRVIVERYIKGREFSCGVLGNRDPTALPLIEIVPKTEFFDYTAKYVPGMAEEITPARLPRRIAFKMQDAALTAYRALGCRGFARVDMFLEEGGKIYTLEVNTIPGMTENSLLPKEARAAGIEFPKLLEMIIGFALECYQP